MDEAILKILLTAKDEASAVIQKTGQSLSKMSGDAQKGADIVNKAMLAIGVGTVAVAGASIKMASDFQQSMNLIQTNAGASAKEVQTMSKAVLDMAASVGTGPNELAQGLYHIESAGFRGAQALDILKASAEGAKVGNANLEDTTQALISLTASHIGGITSETQAMGTLNAIVGSGDMRMEALAQAMSTGIAPAFAAFGLNVKDMGAALATLTDNAVPPIDAATRLRMTVSMMGAPSTAATKALKEVGMSATQMATDMRSGGLFKALEDLQEHLKNLSKPDQQIALARIFGGGRQSATILTLLSQMDRLKSKYTDISEGAGKFGSAWEKTQQNANMAFAKLGAAVQVLGVQFGNQLLPAVTKFANFLGSNLVPDINNLVNWINKNKLALGIIAGFITAVVLPAWITYQAIALKNAVKDVAAFIIQNDKLLIGFIQQSAHIVIVIVRWVALNAVKLAGTAITIGLTAATWLLNAAMLVLTSPITLVILAIIALIAIGVLLITHWKQVQEVGKAVFKAIGDFFTYMGNIAKGVVNQIIADVKHMVNSVIDTINGLIHGVNNISSKVHLPKIPDIPHFEQGGYVPSTGLAILHQGEFVLSRAMLAGQSRIPSQVLNTSTTNNNTPINVYATVNTDMDLGLLANKIAFAVRNSR